MIIQRSVSLFVDCFWTIEAFELYLTMSNLTKTNSVVYQLKEITKVMLATPKFIWDHEVWMAIKEQRGVLIFGICVSFLFTYLLYGDVTAFFSEYFEVANAVAPMTEIGESNLINNTAIERPKIQELVSSNTKFMLMVLLEVVIFTFSVKTLNILRGQDRRLGVKDFWRAEKRMLIIMLLSFIAGVVFLVVTNIAFSIIRMKFLVPAVMFLIYAYILGYAFFDNFNEQFGLEIKQSKNIIWKHKGAALGLGIVASILLMIPLIGALIVPVGGGIAATIYGHRNNMELTPS